MDAISRESLITIWSAYAESRRPRIAPTTYRRDYAAISRRLQGCPYWVQSGADVVTWLLQVYGHETARRTLMQIKAATKWAVKSGVKRHDPLGAIANLPQQSKAVKNWQAFTPVERSAILAAADSLRPRDRRWIHALFYTGARPEELRALQRRHWAKDGSILQIVSAYPIDAEAPQRTKNGKTTPDFPCNKQLRGLLTDATKGVEQESMWIFRGADGGAFNYHNFQSREWRPLVEKLAEDGAIAFPLSQYHARHTWITEALKVMALKDVEYLARVDSATLLRFYAQRNRALEIPEI